MINEENYLNFLIDNKVTQQQFLLLHLLYKDRWDLIELYKKAYPTNDGTIIGRQQTDLLLEKGLLEYYTTTTGGIQIKISEVFKNAYIKDIDIADQIYKIYPDFYESSEGVRYPLLAYDRLSFAKIYLDVIKYDQKEHEEILEDIKFGAEHNLIKIKVSNFLVSHYWKILRKMRKENESDTQNVIEDENDFA